ncbi:MAG: hypothetical protein P4L34_04835 [Paludibacter sp.]|nr:hypothetical protein [Paludibacter sp.]
MRRIFIGLSFFVLTIHTYGQTPHDNLIKYWKYRDRLRTRFMVVSKNVLDYGVNIPASDIFYDKDLISWGDANNNMSHYLSMLATELWLLKNNHQDYSTTLKELYYAMLALERLDTYSESNLRWKAAHGSWLENDSLAKSYVQPGDINGFLLRDDVGDGFWKKYGSHFDVGHCRGNLNNGSKYQLEEMSQDVIEHIMEGLSLVNTLVGTESVAGIPCNLSDKYIKPRLIHLGIMTCDSDAYQSPRSVNFKLWAQDFVKRFILYMQSDGTYKGKIGGIIPFTTHWVLVNPITHKLVLEGNGDDGGVAMISNGLIEAGKAITGENLRIYPGLFTDKEYNLAFRHPKTFQLGKEDNKTRSLACSVSGKKTFAVLRKLRDHYNPHKTGHFPIYEHFPLMYLVLHHLTYTDLKLKDKVYKSEKALYEGLLNSAPVGGPASNCGVYDWTSTSRCLWPENLGKNSTEHIEYNGLDYMMLHNLYCIAFGVKGFKALNIAANKTDNN